MADGLPGIRQTLGIMRRFVVAGRVHPAIRQAAASIVFLTPEKQQHAECAALFEFVRDHIRYTQDVHEVETLTTPDKTLALGYGDCDDQTTLLCALFEAVGYPTRFVVASYDDPRVFEHVYCQVCADGAWIDCDPTEQQEFGWAPPDPVAIAYEV